MKLARASKNVVTVDGWKPFKTHSVRHHHASTVLQLMSASTQLFSPLAAPLGNGSTSHPRHGLLGFSLSQVTCLTRRSRSMEAHGLIDLVLQIACGRVNQLLLGQLGRMRVVELDTMLGF